MDAPALENRGSYHATVSTRAVQVKGFIFWKFGQMVVDKIQGGQMGPFDMFGSVLALFSDIEDRNATLLPMLYSSTLRRLCSLLAAPPRHLALF